MQNFLNFSHFIQEMASQLDKPNPYRCCAFHVHICMWHNQVCSPGLEGCRTAPLPPQSTPSHEQRTPQPAMLPHPARTDATEAVCETQKSNDLGFAL